jgi:hypothetical protein
MIKNRIFALSYRIVAFILCLLGILAAFGIFSGQFYETALLYYTEQSNILVLIFFGVVIYKTATDLYKKGKIGSSSYFPRVSGGILLAIMLTMIIFWSLLAQDIASTFGWNYLFSFKNLGVHLITPILMIFDYIMFNEKGKVKKNDPYIFSIVPLLYLTQAMILGFSGVNYSIDKSGQIVHFPYFFIDYYAIGLWIIPSILGISLFYIGIGKIFLYLDNHQDYFSSLF